MRKCSSTILYAACTFRPYKSIPVLKLFRTFTGKMTRGLSLRMVFSLLFQDTLFKLVAMTGTEVVVASVTSSVTHTMLASDITRSIDERSRRSDWEDHCEDLDERGPDCFRRQYRMPQQTFEKTCRCTASPASTRPPFPRTLLDERMSCIHQQCCTERECVLPTISHSPLTHSAI